jgi:hypothetical protein
MSWKQLSTKARACISEEISKHCRKKRGKCRRSKKARKQAAAIGYSICRRAGHRSIPKRPR